MVGHTYSDTCTILEAAGESISLITKTAIKRKAKEILYQHQGEYWNSTLTPLEVQSKFNDIILFEPQSRTQSVQTTCPLQIVKNLNLQTGLPVGQLLFLIRAGADCLPTPLNLLRWHYRVCNKCPLCNSPTPMSAHILNGCQEALIQGQYTWRHDSVLNCLLSSVRETLSATAHLYADIPTWRASESPPATIPTNISTTRARPDIVLIEDLSVNLIELMIPTNTYEALQAARIRKSEKPLYLQLVSNLEDRGLSVSFQTLKIGSLGHITPYAVKCLTSTFSLSKQHVLSKLSKISIACSYHIFHSRNSLSWESNNPFYTL